MACANVPSKLTATQIKGRPQDQEAAEEAGELAETAGREDRAIYLSLIHICPPRR